MSSVIQETQVHLQRAILMFLSTYCMFTGSLCSPVQCLLIFSFVLKDLNGGNQASFMIFIITPGRTWVPAGEHRSGPELLCFYIKRNQPRWFRHLISLPPFLLRFFGYASLVKKKQNFFGGLTYSPWLGDILETPRRSWRVSLGRGMSGFFSWMPEEWKWANAVRKVCWFLHSSHETRNPFH